MDQYFQGGIRQISCHFFCPIDPALICIFHFWEIVNISQLQYSWLSLSRTRKGLYNLLEIERARDREREIGYSLHKGTETLVQDREKFEIEGVRDRESQRYMI